MQLGADEEPVQQVAPEGGLRLLTANNATGYKNVYIHRGAFKAEIHRRPTKYPLGVFSTAAEAALAVARHLGPEGYAAATTGPASVAVSEPMTM